METTLAPEIWMEIHARRKSMSMEQQHLFLELLEQVPTRVQVLGWLYYYGALRTSEVKRVRRDHICNVRNFVAVRSSKRRNAPKGSPNWRTIPLPCHVIQTLLELPVGDDQPLFPEHRTTLLRWIQPLLEAVGCEGPAATTRTFRHSFKDRSEKQKNPISVTANLLGHSKRTDRQHYGDPMGYELATFAKETWEVRC